MSFNIIDRRVNGKSQSSVNRSKFLKRVTVKNKIKEKIKEFIQKGDVADISNSKGDKIKVPVRDINEPSIHHGDGGANHRVHPGNKTFGAGDRFKRPPQSSDGKGGHGSADGEGDDEFVFELTRDEFLEFFFEDLELPDLVRKQLSVIKETTQRRAGFSSDGAPSRLDFLQSMKQSVGRRSALRSPKKKKLKELLALAATLEEQLQVEEQESIRLQLNSILEEIESLKRKIKNIPFVDDVDLRYRQWVVEPIPIHKAVVFNVMDVSGSMNEWKQDLAKRFYMLLYLFLDRNYDKIDIVFIRHHSVASECTENEFFYGTETGGTVVSPALQLVVDIQKQRYPLNKYNVYVAQTSDGDNSSDDNVVVKDLLINHILPMVQHYFYIEIEHHEAMWRSGTSDLWGDYEAIMKSSDKMAMGKIQTPADIYPVFRKLFEKR